MENPTNAIERRRFEDNLYKRLPVPIQSLTKLFKERERDISFLSNLGVLSNCLPNVCGIYDGDTVYSHLYVIIIAPPASGKGVMNYSRLLIDKIHKTTMKTSKQAKKECENRLKENKDKKQDFEPCPELEIKVLPANISISEMYSFLRTSKHGLLIIESEADTISNMLKIEWGNYSDVLRKTFHHEPVSISRKMDNIFVEIQESKLAMVISGTPDQLQPLIKSKDNGLFSRFMIYNFDEISDFKDVFAPKSRNIKEVFQNAGEEIFKMYNKLMKLKTPIEFQFDKNQQRRFVEKFKTIRTDIIKQHSQSFLPNMNRHGLIMFRIAMILTVLRNIDNLGQPILTCANRDYVCALVITQNLLRHSLYTFTTIDNNFLSVLDSEILDDLPNFFSREEALEIADKHQMPKRTLDDKLVQWQKNKFIKKVKRGNYKKL